MSVKLRDLIKNVRSCKTAAEERAVIAKECALIRTAIKEQADTGFRHRNVAKLLFIHMLGYPTHFGQVECLKLIASQRFPETRVGYLGLMILLDERQEVLMLVTNCLKNDFQNPNPYVSGLALCSLGNIASADISRDLASEVEKLFRHSNPYIRKKAALAAVRIVRKVPELVEDFVQGALSLLSDKNHAVLVSAVTLIIDMLRADSKFLPNFRKEVGQVVRLLKAVVLAGYVSEYDVCGITDPFLQCKLLQLLRLLGTGSQEASDEMNDILAQVAINTESTKNPGNAILYECVQTIMAIEAESGLRVLAVNILGRFLLNRDNNIRYVALNTLCKVVQSDTQAIQRHRNTIVDCLKDSDISIRRRALDLIKALVTKTNVRPLVKELLNYLGYATGDAEFKSDLTEKICFVVDKYAPSKRWHIDTIIDVLAKAGSYTRESVSSNLITLISRAKSLHAYTAFRVFNELKNMKSTELPLVHVGLWVVGEYGDHLVSPASLAVANSKGASFAQCSESDVGDLIEQILKAPTSTVVTKAYALNALVKLSGRFKVSKDRLLGLVSLFETSMSVELQQRSCEYAQLFKDNLEGVRAKIVVPMPTMEKKKRTAVDSQSLSSSSKSERKKKDDDDDDDDPEEKNENTKNSKGAKSNTAEFSSSEDESEPSDDEGEDESTDAPAETETETVTNGTSELPSKKRENSKKSDNTQVITNGTTPSSANLLDIFSGGPVSSSPSLPNAKTSVTQPQATQGALALNPLDSLMDIFGPSSQPQPQLQSQPSQKVDPLAALMASRSSGPAPNTAAFPFAAPSSSQAAIDPLAMFMGPGPVMTAPSPPPNPNSSQAHFPLMTVLDKDGILITFQIKKPAADRTLILATFVNRSQAEVTNFDFKVAVPKYLKLKMKPASSSTLPPLDGKATQGIEIENSAQGQKKIMLRVKVDYSANAAPVSEQFQVDAFPDGV